MTEQDKRFALRCRFHDQDFLPYACDQCCVPVCGECLTSNHSRHKLSNVSNVAQQLKEEIQQTCDQTKLLEIRSEIEGDKKLLSSRFASVEKEVKLREEIVISKVKCLTQKVFGTAKEMFERDNKSFERDMDFVDNLLKGVELDDTTKSGSIECVHVHAELIRICRLNRKQPKDLQFKFKAMDKLHLLPMIFGGISGNSSNCQDDMHGDVDFNYSKISKLAPINDRQVYLLWGDFLYFIDFHGANIIKLKLCDNEIIDFNVIRANEILAIERSRTKIQRIRARNPDSPTCHNFIHSDDNTKIVYVGRGAHYATVVCNGECKGTFNFMQNYYLDILELDVTGIIRKQRRITPSFSNTINKHSMNNRVHVEESKNLMIVLDGTSSRCVYIYDLNPETPSLLHTYTGAIGVNPSSRFNPTDVCFDSKGKMLITVLNDNAVHVLNNEFKVEKILMTADDGLKEPHSVAMDESEHVWVGCTEKIHIINYEYFLTTDIEQRMETTRNKKTVFSKRINKF